jgi:hypothetical protein
LTLVVDSLHGFPFFPSLWRAVRGRTATAAGGWAMSIDSTVLTSRIPCCTASPMTTDGGSPAKAATVDVPPPPHPLFHDRGEGERERKRERENWCRLQTSLRDRPLESGRRGDLELGLLETLCSSPPPSRLSSPGQMRECSIWMCSLFGPTQTYPWEKVPIFRSDFP